MQQFVSGVCPRHTIAIHSVRNTVGSVFVRKFKLFLGQCRVKLCATINMTNDVLNQSVPNTYRNMYL